MHEQQHNTLIKIKQKRYIKNKTEEKIRKFKKDRPRERQVMKEKQIHHIDVRMFIY